MTNFPSIAFPICATDGSLYVKAPAITSIEYSPDGSRILFVSDRDKDDSGRANNNIYVMNADGSQIQQLTANGSDDILPAWSPTDPNVIFVGYAAEHRFGALSRFVFGTDFAATRVRQLFDA